MTFENPQQVLEWYFRKRYVVRPKFPGNHDPANFLGGGKRANLEDIFKTLTKVIGIIKTLAYRERKLIQQISIGIPISTIAKRRGFSPSTIRRMRDRIMRELSIRFEAEKLLLDGCPESIVYQYHEEAFLSA